MKKYLFMSVILLTLFATSCNKDRIPTTQDTIKHGYVLACSDWNDEKKEYYTDIILNGTELETQLFGDAEGIYYDAEGNYWTICYTNEGDGHLRVYKNDESIYDVEQSEGTDGLYYIDLIRVFDGIAYVAMQARNYKSYVLIINGKEQTLVPLPNDFTNSIFDIRAYGDRLYFLSRISENILNLYSCNKDFSDIKKECTIVDETSFTKIQGLPDDAELDGVYPGILTMKSPTDFYVSFNVESNCQYAFTYHNGTNTLLGTWDDRSPQGACLFKGDYYVSTWYNSTSSNNGGEIFKNGSIIYIHNALNVSDLCTDGTNLYAILSGYDDATKTQIACFYKNGEITALNSTANNRYLLSAM